MDGDQWKARLIEPLREVVAWFEQERPISCTDGSVRSTSRLQVDEEFASDQPQLAVEQIVRARRALLMSDVQVQAKQPPRGRLLILFTDWNLKDGAAREVSGGFVGSYNMPPCDTWVAFLEHIPVDGGLQPGIVCWVPADLIEHAQWAIDINPEECLVWADELGAPFTLVLGALVDS